MTEPFSWPMTQTLSPRNRPKPPTIASSSPNLRSPASGTKSVISRGDIVEAVRPLRMARDLGLLPRRQIGVEIGERVGRLALETGDLLADRRRGVGIGERAQLLDLGLDLGDRLFEIEVAAHQRVDRR